MRRLLSALLLLAAALSPTAGRAAWTARPADYPAVAIQRDVRITMSDGVRLTADVLRPATSAGPVEGRFPVLLTQTPYNKAATGLNFRIDYLVQRGYVQVIVDVRGTGGSEGVWDSFGTREQLDGKELVEWAASLDRPWSNGSVGLHGTSYGAINQLFTAAHRPAGLKALFPIVPMADAYRDITGSGGQLNTSFIPSWLGLVTAMGLVPPTYAPNDPVGAAAALASHAGGIAQFQAATVAKSTTGGDTAYDGPFYRQRSPIEVIDRVQVPTFVVGGWFDLFQRGEPMLYNRLRANGVPTRLLMGPWYHVSASDTFNGLPQGGVHTLAQYELRWMDRYLRGIPDPDLDTDVAPVTYNRLGSGTWETATSWPPPGVTHKAHFLSGPSVAGVQAGSLQEAAPAAQDPDTMVWQPASGVCSRSVAQWTANGVNQGCETDQRTNAVGGLTYELPAGASGLNLSGPVAARLFVSNSTPDAFLSVRLEDVDASGKATQITAGWALVSQRALDPAKTVVRDGLIVQPYHPYTQASQQLLAPGEIVEVWVEIFPTAARIAPGHLLRLAIQPSDAPHLSAPATQAANLAGGVLSLYHDAAHPSAVVLPVG